MDKIEALGSTIAQISLYDLKSYYNQAKAVVLNYTEMEAKVRDATNDDPWGASSTLMQEIAQGTFNFQQFNEIMPTIYKRFTEKEAREWRQIYKALQLLEYLIKHGSERVIDDARSHISMIKILKNFHYVDDKGKDQGINVRNRAKEISELLSDLDRVRQERRKAKASRNKYTGVGNEGPSFTSPTGSKYGGFGSDTGGFSGAGGGDDWNNGGGSTSRDRYTAGGSSSFKQNEEFEEYDAGEWEDRPAATASTTRTSPPSNRSGTRHRAPSITVTMKKTTEKAAPPPKAKEVDLFSMGDDDNILPASTTAAAKAPVSQSGSALNALDDDFDDFQSAPPPHSLAAASTLNPMTQSTSAAKPNVFALLNSTASVPAAPTTNPMMTMGSGGTGMNVSTFQQPVSAGNMNMFGGSSMMQPTLANPVQNSAATASKPAVNDFDDLFSFAGLGSSSSTKPNNTNPQAKISMAAMAKQQSSASIWGNGAPSKPTPPASFGGMTGTTSSHQSSSNNDDLLL